MMLSSKGITTQSDLQTFLQSCPKCSDFTNNGTYIVSHKQLPSVHIDTKFRKHGIIINSESDNTLGHWITLLVFNNKYLVICDGLCTVNRRKDIMNNIRLFCTLNHLTPKNLKLPCQTKQSLKCGYIALFFIGKGSVLTYHSFLAMTNLLKQYSLHNREKFMLAFVMHHFKI